MKGEAGADYLCLGGGGSDTLYCGDDEDADHYATLGTAVGCDAKDVPLTGNECQTICSGQ